MDSLQATVTSLAVIALLLLMAVFVCHYFGPKATAWVWSNREEKIGLSKSRLFNANGYMIHSGSDFLLSSSGSFKRFDSIDRDYKQVGQSPAPTPTWNLTQTEIPPQPLRPAPVPLQTAQTSDIIIDKPPQAQKQKSFETESISTAIPRPTTKRQLSTPTKSQNGTMDELKINLSDTVSKIQNGYKASSTNPFLNGTLKSLQEIQDNRKHFEKTENSDEANNAENIRKDNMYYNAKNPFTADCVQRTLSQRTDVFCKAAPKTAVDSKTFFDFEPIKISSLLDSSITIIPKAKNCCYENSVIEENDIFQDSNCNGETIGKFADSPATDTFDCIEKLITKQYRNRSYSETEGHKVHIGLLSSNSTNPFLDNGHMHKTVSENYLAKGNHQTWNFGRSLSRQESNTSLGRRNSSQSSLDAASLDNVHIQRALSCDSVSSESSVILADLEQTAPAVTGQLCVGLQYDKNSMTDDAAELIVTVMEAKELIGPPTVESFDTFVRIYLVPDETNAVQTKIFKNSSCPSYNETFCFWLNRKRTRRSLWFHLYHSGNVHILIGEAELQIGDITRPMTTWLPLSDSRQSSNVWGELMFSLSYLPTAERLTVVVVKGRNLKLDQGERETIDLQNIFVKVYLLKDDKKVSKKKTSVKRVDRCPIFNESMNFSIPPYILNTIQLRLTVILSNETDMLPIGHVIVGGNTSGKGLRHWHQMLSSLRKPVAMWHALRQRSNRKEEKT